MKISEVIHKLEEIYPIEYQETYDNCGIQVGNINQPLTSILLTTDVTENTISEAINLKANLIISHHPLIFHGIKHLTGHNYIERVLIEAIKHNIVIYAVHTNIDKILNGVSFEMAQKLQLQNIEFLHPMNDGKVGLGCIGSLSEPKNEIEFLTKIKSVFNTPMIKCSNLLNRNIKQVAMCGGSGAEFIKDAIKSNADIYITSDIKYHDFFLAENKIVIADIGHFESEQYTKYIFRKQLIDFFPNFALHIAKSDIPPIMYI